MRQGEKLHSVPGREEFQLALGAGWTGGKSNHRYLTGFSKHFSVNFLSVFFA